MTINQDVLRHCAERISALPVEESGMMILGGIVFWSDNREPPAYYRDGMPASFDDIEAAFRLLWKHL